jgi:uncharacterized protein DUF6969
VALGKVEESLWVSWSEIDRMTAAAALIREIGHELAGRNLNILSEVMTGHLTISDWRHYPDEDVYDPNSHAQYFYHTHPVRRRTGREHGHFHTFLRAEGMPVGVAPLLLPEIAVAEAPPPPPQAPPLRRGIREEVSHLVAIVVDCQGRPVRLFTTNRWVTGETWYPADDVIRMLDRFEIAEVGPSQTLNQWLGAVFRLFRPQIAELLRLRDQTVMAWRRRRRTHVFDDPALEITSSLDISLDAQLAFLDRVRSEKAARGVADRMPVVPAMSDGWGEAQMD